MVQLDILSGKKAGTRWLARRLPVRIGRASDNEFQLEDDGVWDKHLHLNFQPQQGFVLTTDANALTTVNGQPVQTALLRNGDIIAIGSAKLQFWLGATRQRSLRARELFVWALLALVASSQFALIYRLLH